MKVLGDRLDETEACGESDVGKICNYLVERGYGDEIVVDVIIELRSFRLTTRTEIVEVERRFGKGALIALASTFKYNVDMYLDVMRFSGLDMSFAADDKFVNTGVRRLILNHFKAVDNKHAKKAFGPRISYEYSDQSEETLDPSALHAAIVEDVMNQLDTDTQLWQYLHSTCYGRISKELLALLAFAVVDSERFDVYGTVSEAWSFLSNNKAITAYELLTGERMAKMTDAQLLALDESGQLRKYLNMLDTPANIKDVVNDASIEYESRLDTAMKQMTVNRLACPKSKDGE